MRAREPIDPLLEHKRLDDPLHPAPTSSSLVSTDLSLATHAKLRVVI